ncbi:MFS transporter [Actinoplanes couchii]|uniref:Major facilitator superfamily MFS_1 n=1 Tax=Actinoplanes couchii TaxID=403638 RepID=A0ABQ3XNW8_9ACTN|nr:MFS transporter [Actinoplanes couchii]MDR6318596.1 MFS family permease [Actinoplanes couchii]GID60205.1 hypothetical protein Aco03nite_086090 [Actinoplanes couchii]
MTARALPLLFTSRALSQTGTSLQGIAQSLIILAIPGGDRLVGLVAVLPTVSVLLLGGVGGRLADRFSPRAVLLGTQPALAMIALGMGLGKPGDAGILAGVVLLNLVAALGTAAWQVLISGVTGDGRIRPGTIVNTVALDTGLIAGSLIAAPTITTLGTGGAFVLNAVSYAVPTIVLLLLPDARRTVTPRAFTARQLLAGLIRDREVVTVTVAATAAALVGTSLPTLLLLLVHHERATDVAVYGLFLGAMSAGSLIGGILTWRWRSSVRTVRIEAAALGVLVLAVAVASGTIVTAALLLPVGFLFLTLRAGVTTFIQQRAPAGGQATAVALLSLVLAGAQIVGTTGFTFLAAVLGVRHTIAVAGALLLLAVLAVLTVVAVLGRRHGNRDRPAPAARVPAGRRGGGPRVRG